MMKNRTAAILLCVFILIIIILGCVYYLSEKKTYSAGQPDIDLMKREYKNIDSPVKLWLNGYLCLFFNFRYMGNINWLILPLLIIFIADIRKRKRSEAALFTVYILSVLLIGIKGYFNFRYALTLVPITIMAAMFLGWEFLSKFDRPVRRSVYVFLSVVVLFNYSVVLNISLKGLQEVNRLIAKFREGGHPRRILEYINNLELGPDDNILVSNAPNFYYYTNKKATTLYRNFGSMFEMIESDDFRYDTVVWIFNFMKSNPRIKYIYMRDKPEWYHKGLVRFVSYGCDAVLSENGYTLYIMRDKCRTSDEIMNAADKGNSVNAP